MSMFNFEPSNYSGQPEEQVAQIVASTNPYPASLFVDPYDIRPKAADYPNVMKYFNLLFNRAFTKMDTNSWGSWVNEPQGSLKYRLRSSNTSSYVEESVSTTWNDGQQIAAEIRTFLSKVYAYQQAIKAIPSVDVRNAYFAAENSLEELPEDKVSALDKVEIAHFYTLAFSKLLTNPWGSWVTDTKWPKKVQQDYDGMQWKAYVVPARKENGDGSSYTEYLCNSARATSRTGRRGTTVSEASDRNEADAKGILAIYRAAYRYYLLLKKAQADLATVRDINTASSAYQTQYFTSPQVTSSTDQITALIVSKDAELAAKNAAVRAIPANSQDAASALKRRLLINETEELKAAIILLHTAKFAQLDNAALSATITNNEEAVADAAGKYSYLYSRSGSNAATTVAALADLKKAITQLAASLTAAKYVLSGTSQGVIGIKEVKPTIGVTKVIGVPGWKPKAPNVRVGTTAASPDTAASPANAGPSSTTTTTSPSTGTLQWYDSNAACRPWFRPEPRR